MQPAKGSLMVIFTKFCGAQTGAFVCDFAFQVMDCK